MRDGNELYRWLSKGKGLRYELTYEGWKLRVLLLPHQDPDDLGTSLPMRDGNPGRCLDPCSSILGYELTYEGWKLSSLAAEALSTSRYELTYEGWKHSSEASYDPLPPRYELTYEGWKRSI